MRATRAYLTSLGTTGLLIASSLLLLLAGSTLFAFDGWPGTPAASEVQSVVVQTGSAATAPEANTGPSQLAAVAAPIADSVAQAPLAPAAGDGPGTGTTPRRPGNEPGGNAPTGDDNQPQPQPQPPVEQPVDPQPPRPPGPPSGGIELPGGGRLLAPGEITLIDGLADGVESVTTALGNTVGGPLGGLLTGTGQGVTDLVRALDGTPPAPR